MKIFKGEFYRISVLTDKLVRLEYSKTGSFEDRITQLIYNRDLAKFLRLYRDIKRTRYYDGLFSFAL